MKKLELPIDVEDIPLGEISLPERELLKRYGEGVTPAVRAFTFPGPKRAWAIGLDDGQIVLILYDISHGTSQIFANPKDLDRALRGLGISHDHVVWRPDL